MKNVEMETNLNGKGMQIRQENNLNWNFHLIASPMTG